MKRILVIGCPGSGKSTFSISLSQLTKIPLYHLDLLNWNEDGTNVKKSIFLNRLEKILEKDSWIIDGNYGSTLERRMRKADTIIFLDYPTNICLEGIRNRKGKKRTDMPWIEPEDYEDEEFNEFVRNFKGQSRRKILKLIEKYADREIIIFRNRQESKKFLDGILYL